MINRLMKHKRGIALGFALLMGGGVIGSSIENIKAYTETVGNIRNTVDYWNPSSGSFDYYGKLGRHSLKRLQFSDGQAAICLDATKALNTGKTGTIISSTYEAGTFPTGVSRDGAEILGYALAMAGGANGGRIEDPYWYCICQCLCWMTESKGGNVTWEDLEEWKIQTKELGKHLNPKYIDYNEFEKRVDYFVKEALRQIRPEAVASFMSKYPSEAPILELDYNEDTGVYEKDFELIHYLDAVAAGYEQVWMQYFLDYDTAIAKLEAEGKIDPGTLKIIHNNEDPSDPGRNWVHVEYTGDIEKLKACGPIPLQFAEGDGKSNTFKLDSLDIWTPNDSGQQHLLANVNTSDWTVYMNFGGNYIPPTPGTGSGDGSYTVTVNTHKHEETFVSNYNIDLYKYDFETGQPLENSEFEILERMDTSQFDDSVDHNGGNPEGTYPLDDLNFDKFSQVKYDTEKPTDDWEVCGTFTTDENGHINHKDVFNYDFTATYCDGHPDPEIEYIECDHEEGEDCDCEEKNEQLEKDAWEAWQKAVDECAARTNFHSVNEGEGKQACEEYRDSVWDAFIHLDYQYTAREKTARSGYILHDIHVDDNPVETVEFDASEAHDSGDYSTATGKFEGNIKKRADGNGSVSGSVKGLDYTATKSVSGQVVSDDEAETATASNAVPDTALCSSDILKIKGGLSY